MVNPIRPGHLPIVDLEHPHAPGRALTVMPGRAPGPSMAIGPDGSDSANVLDSVIVCAEPKTVGSNWITLPARLGLASAWPIT